MLSRKEWLILIADILLILALLIFPHIVHSTKAFKLYVHNRDSKNYYHIRLKNEDTGWYDARNVEANDCIAIYRLEQGEYSIRTYRDGTDVGHYRSFKIKNDHKCLEITPVTGKMRSCNRNYCN